jgi:hypothetical protein
MFKKLLKRKKKGAALINTAIAIVFASLISAVLVSVATQNIRFAYMQERRIDSYLAARHGFEVVYGALIDERPANGFGGGYSGTTHLYEVYANTGTNSGIPTHTVLPDVMSDVINLDPNYKVNISLNKAKDAGGSIDTHLVIIKSVSEIPYLYNGNTLIATSTITAEVNTSNPELVTIKVN